MALVSAPTPGLIPTGINTKQVKTDVEQCVSSFRVASKSLKDCVSISTQLSADAIVTNAWEQATMRFWAAVRDDPRWCPLC